MKRTLDVNAMGVLALGFALPSLGGMTYDYLAGLAGGRLNMLENIYVKPVVLSTLSAGIIYLASRYGLVSNSTAVAAAGVSTFLYAASMVKSSGVLSSIPYVGDSLNSNIPSLMGIGGSNFGGYQGGYLGYLGSEHAEMGPQMLDTPTDASLYGVGSSPQVNIF